MCACSFTLTAWLCGLDGLGMTDVIRSYPNDNRQVANNSHSYPNNNHSHPNDWQQGKSDENQETF